MARALRVQFDGAVYHVTSRGNAAHAIFLDDADRARYLDTLLTTPRGSLSTAVA